MTTATRIEAGTLVRILPVLRLVHARGDGVTVRRNYPHMIGRIVKRCRWWPTRYAYVVDVEGVRGWRVYLSPDEVEVVDEREDDK